MRRTRRDRGPYQRSLCLSRTFVIFVCVIIDSSSSLAPFFGKHAIAISVVFSDGKLAIEPGARTSARIALGLPNEHSSIAQCAFQALSQARLPLSNKEVDFW